MKRSLSIIAAFTSAALLAGCAGGGYKQGVAGNVLQYREYSNVMHSQQNSLNSCFNAAGQTKSSGDLALCAVLAAGTNAQQTLAGQPAPIRIAKSPEEIAETIITRGLDAAVKIYGVKAVSDAVIANANALRDTAATGAAANAEIANAGIEAAAKPPLVVHTPAPAAAPAPTPTPAP